jgi:hypothetical protein
MNDIDNTKIQKNSTGGAVSVERNVKRRVIRWAGFVETKKMDISIGGLGGWFGFDKKGQRWKDYIEEIREDLIPYAEAIKESVIENNIRYTGIEHQNVGDGVPIFDDNTIGSFTFRAWGDIMAAIWSDIDNKDYNYMDYYC